MRQYADLQKSIEDFISQSNYNRLPEKFNNGRIFSKPLFGVAMGDDPIFLKYKDVVHPEHLTPLEMWQKNYPSDSKDIQPQLRLLSIIFPYEKHIRDANKGQREMPARIYCVGRNYANAFINEVLQETIKLFQRQGYRAFAGVLSQAYRVIKLERGFASTWSERHMAFAAGLGTFSLHEGLITDAGCNVRIASVLTDAPLPVTLRKSDAPYAHCLYYAKDECKKCVERCPAEAISENGHDKIKCSVYRRKVAKKMNQLLGPLLKPNIHHVDKRGNIFHKAAKKMNRSLRSFLRPHYKPVGCALCQFNVPCMDKNPMASREKEGNSGCSMVSPSVT